MYVVMNFGVFICSNCSGIHREMNHKVKGINMCNFTEVELAFLIENGNANQQQRLMGDWSAKTSPLPEKSDNFRMKEFFKAKYTDRRFEIKLKDSDSDSD